MNKLIELVEYAYKLHEAGFIVDGTHEVKGIGKVYVGNCSRFKDTLVTLFTVGICEPDDKEGPRVQFHPGSVDHDIKRTLELFFSWARTTK